MSNSRLRVEPAELISAASDLDRIADRLELALTGAGRALPAPAPGPKKVFTPAPPNFPPLPKKPQKDTD
ncbi:PE family protein, partial [Gordonia terrae]